MRKLIIFLITIVILTTGVYAGDDEKVQELLKPGHNLEYIAHANGRTYVIYTEKNELDEEYYYLGTIANGQIATIGDIDEMIGGNNEPTHFKIAGRAFKDRNYYMVTGMTQVNGEIYVSKKRHIYKLVGDKLVDIPFKHKGSKLDLNNYAVVIGRFTSNSTDLFIALRKIATVTVEDSYDKYDSPADRAVFKVSTTGNITPLNYIVWDFLVKVPSSEEHIISQISFNDNEQAVHMAGGTTPITLINLENPMKRIVVETDAKNHCWLYYEDSHYENVLLFNDYMLSYMKGPYISRRGSILIKKIDVKPYKSVTSRDGSLTKNISKSITYAIIEHNDYILHWTKGDDGNVYMITKDTEPTTTSAYVLK